MPVLRGERHAAVHGSEHDQLLRPRGVRQHHGPLAQPVADPRRLHGDDVSRGVVHPAVDGRAVRAARAADGICRGLVSLLQYGEYHAIDRLQADGLRCYSVCVHLPDLFGHRMAAHPVVLPERSDDYEDPIEGPSVGRVC